MRRLLYLAALSMVATLMLAPAAFAQSRGPSGADGTFNCEDFDTQPQAQDYYESIGGLNGTNPADLDDDLDGVACETLPPGPAMTAPEPEMTTEQPDPCPDPNFPRQTPDGCQASPLPDVTTQETAGETQYEIEPGTGPLVGGPAIEDPVGVDEALPDTGGPALLLPASGLLLGAGLFGMRMVRRRS